MRLNSGLESPALAAALSQSEEIFLARAWPGGTGPGLALNRAAAQGAAGHIDCEEFIPLPAASLKNFCRPFPSAATRNGEIIAAGPESILSQG